jgi:hypothetical protein
MKTKERKKEKKEKNELIVQPGSISDTGRHLLSKVLRMEGYRLSRIRKKTGQACRS